MALKASRGPNMSLIFCAYLVLVLAKTNAEENKECNSNCDVQTQTNQTLNHIIGIDTCD